MHLITTKLRVNGQSTHVAVILLTGVALYFMFLSGIRAWADPRFGIVCSGTVRSHFPMGSILKCSYTISSA